LVVWSFRFCDENQYTLDMLGQAGEGSTVTEVAAMQVDDDEA
jgi:hypothetical protein